MANHGKLLQQWLPTLSKALSLYNGLNRMESSVPMQLCTGKIGLKAYLASISRADSDRCAYNQAPKTPHHIILDCPLHDNLRRRIFRDAFQTPRTLNDCLTEPKLVKLVTRFVIETGLISHLNTTTTGSHAPGSQSVTSGTPVQAPATCFNPHFPPPADKRGPIGSATSNQRQRGKPPP
jgi:hypothetical protein